MGVDNKNKNFVTRPLQSEDYYVVAAGLFNNIMNSFKVFSDELLELAIYNANRQSHISHIWEEFTQDLESIQEDQDGA